MLFLSTRNYDHFYNFIVKSAKKNCEIFTKKKLYEWHKIGAKYPKSKKFLVKKNFWFIFFDEKYIVNALNNIPKL